MDWLTTGSAARLSHMVQAPDHCEQKSTLRQPWRQIPKPWDLSNLCLSRAPHVDSTNHTGCMTGRGGGPWHWVTVEELEPGKNTILILVTNINHMMVSWTRCIGQHWTVAAAMLCSRSSNSYSFLLYLWQWLNVLDVAINLTPIPALQPTNEAATPKSMLLPRNFFKSAKWISTTKLKQNDNG